MHMLPQSRVALFFSRMNPAGAELRTIEVVESTGFSFDFFAVSGDQGLLDNRLIDSGHRVFQIRLSIVGLFRITAALRRNRYLVVHSQLGSASGPILLCAKLAGIPTRIAHFRSDAVGGRSSRIRRMKLSASRWLVDQLATTIVGVSPGALATGWKSDWTTDDRCLIVQNGVDAGALRVSSSDGNALRPSVSERIVVANIGRVEPSKNRGRAVEIWQDLAKSHPTQLLLVGEVNDADRKLVSAWRASPESPVGGSEISEVGESDNVPSYLSRAHVLLVTSLREGLPGVVLESLAVGTPVVGSDLPGTAWISSLNEGVTICALSDPNAVWVDAIRAAADADRDKIVASFDNGPFILERVVPEFRKLWMLNE